VLRQTIFFPVLLFSRYFRGGTVIRVVLSSGAFSGETLPQWVGPVAGPRRELDVSAVVVDGRSVRIAIVNRSESREYTDVPLRILGVDDTVKEVESHEMWDKDLKARNTWEEPNRVQVHTRRSQWEGKWTFRPHSFTLLVLDLDT
jgi:alpha-L-arabinofuranosidase